MLLLLPLLAAADPIAPAALARTTPIDYAADVQPIFAAKCTVCHSGKNLEGQYDMGTHAAVLKGGKRGPAVVPGKPAESSLFLFGSHAKKPIMPPKDEENPLTGEQVAVLKRWIEQGAKGPTSPEVKTRPSVTLAPPPAVVTPVRAVAVRPDKGVVAAGRGNKVHLFDGKTGEFKASLADPALKDAAHVSLVEAMAFHPTGTTLATGSFREVVLWDADTRSIVRRLTGFADRVVALAFSPDGALLATGGGAPTEDGEVKIFDAATGKLVVELKNPHSDTVFGVCFSPDGKLLATAGADKFVKVFEVPSGKLSRAFEGHTNHVMDVGFTPDGKRLASAGADGVVKLWDYEKGEKVRDIPGHQKQVTRLVFVGKNPTFLTASGDASVRLWNAETGGQSRTFAGHTDFVYAVAASGDGTLVASGGEDGVVRLFNGQTGQLIKATGPPEGAKK